MKNFNKYKRVFFFTAAFVFLLSFCAFAESISVIPCGETVGVKIYTEGLLVVGTDSVKEKSGKKVYPASRCGIKINDIILKADNIELTTTEQFSEIVSSRLSGVNLSVKRGNDCFDVFAVPAVSEDGRARLGLWVRDSTAGIGTVTYINPENMSFAALGHGICDVDTGNILSVKSGNILNCPVLSVTKSKKGSPGEISGSFDNVKLGSITKNTVHGIFGKAEDGAFSLTAKEIPVAHRSEVQTGNACILSDFENGEVKEYEIQINKISKSADDKAIVFEVTDDTLKEKAGGIVQGMSGAPIIQNGKLVGAVTHVFVNDPEKGYGILAETMYKN